MSLTRLLNNIGRQMIRNQKKKSKLLDKKINPQKSGYLNPWIDPSKTRNGLDKLRAEYLNYVRNMPYNEYLLSDHWQHTRKKCLEAYGYKCSDCGSSYNLEVHHDDYSNKGFEQIGIDIRPLCKPCHGNYKGAKKIH